MFYSIMHSPIRSNHFVSPAILIFVSSTVSVLTLIMVCLDCKTAITIAASNRFKSVLHCRPTVVKAPKYSYATPILISLHWLKINERIKYKLLSLANKVLTTSQPDNLISVQSLMVQSTGRTHSSSVVNLSPSLDHPPYYKSPTALSDMHHLTCGISSLLYSVNLILFTVLLVHLILHVSPHQSPPAYLLSPSITRMTFHWKLIFFTHPFLHSHSYHGLPSRSRILTCIEIKGHWRLFVLVSSFYIFFWLRVLD